MTDHILAFAHNIHAGQMYGDKPYVYHLLDVEQVLADAGMVSDDDRIIAHCHDSIEDCEENQRGIVLDYLQTNTSSYVYSVIWAMSGFGTNRRQRNADVYSKIITCPDAANYKVADRIANMEHTKKSNPRLFRMYMKEAPDFYARVVTLASCQALVDRFRSIAGMEAQVRLELTSSRLATERDRPFPPLRHRPNFSEQKK